ncbi:hypothetical protein [Caballeronia sp. HLA56]
MRSHIHDATKAFRSTQSNTARRVRAALGACLCVIAPLAFGTPGGEPLVLDTQTGIHSGVPGTVLQTGPLGGPGMVPMATLPGPPQQDQPPIVVSPYIDYSSGQATAPAQSNGRRHGNSRTPYP